MDIKLEPGGDLDFSSGDLQTIIGQDEIAQSLFIRLNLQLGEIDHAQGIGVPYVEIVFEVAPSEDLLRFAFLPTIEETPGVLSVINLDFDAVGPDRVLVARGSALTTDGPITFDSGIETV